MALDDGLDDAPEADWGTHLTRLALAGALGRAGRWLLDLPALAQPYACASSLCAPGRRSPRARSCCADLDLSPTPEERAAIAARLPEVAAAMGDDPRWRAGAPRWHDGERLTRPGRRCVFARATADGLSCALHDLGLKPAPCRLFPLAVVDLGEGRRLLTAIHRTTAAALATRPARAFPCLGRPDAPALLTSEAEVAAALLGPRIFEAAEAAVARYRAGAC